MNPTWSDFTPDAFLGRVNSYIIEWDFDSMVWVSPGTFTMGSPETEPDRDSDEGPQTVVTLTNGFYMGKYEVTQREYQAVMGTNPSSFKGSTNLPVELVSWNDAMNYCGKLTALERTAGRLPTGHEYRLPTEAEWEYACRAGTTTATSYGDSLSSTLANFDGNHPYDGAAEGPNLRRTAEAGSYPPNAWGFYDMAGNVLEWCLDFYGGSLPAGRVTEQEGSILGLSRVVRGGGWYAYGRACRSADRLFCAQDGKANNIGFRVVLAPRQP